MVSSLNILVVESMGAVDGLKEGMARLYINTTRNIQVE
jgi:hypothetical protein